jgi:hypothetical protein
MDLEATARGYIKRLDVLALTKELKHKVEKAENRKNDEGKQAYFLLLYAD